MLCGKLISQKFLVTVSKVMEFPKLLFRIGIPLAMLFQLSPLAAEEYLFSNFCLLYNHYGLEDLIKRTQTQKTDSSMCLIFDNRRNIRKQKHLKTQIIPNLSVDPKYTFTAITARTETTNHQNQ